MFREIKKKLWLDSNRWDHDRFDLSKQGPKTREELMTLYGYDIRAHSKPPETVPFLNNSGRWVHLWFGCVCSDCPFSGKLVLLQFWSTTDRKAFTSYRCLQGPSPWRQVAAGGFHRSGAVPGAAAWRRRSRLSRRSRRLGWPRRRVPQSRARWTGRRSAGRAAAVYVAHAAGPAA